MGNCSLCTVQSCPNVTDKIAVRVSPYLDIWLQSNTFNKQKKLIVSSFGQIFSTLEFREQRDFRIDKSKHYCSFTVKHWTLSFPHPAFESQNKVIGFSEAQWVSVYIPAPPRREVTQVSFWSMPTFISPTVPSKNETVWLTTKSFSSVSW